MSQPELLLDALDPDQRAVAEALEGPVLVVAGAGSGKTRAITHRIAYGVATGAYQPAEVLALSFTTRAAGEMRERLAALGASGVQARTFHSAALRQLRFFFPRTYGVELPQIIESKLSLVAAAARAAGVSADQSTLKDLAAVIEWAKVSEVSPDRFAERATSTGHEVQGVAAEVVGRVFAAYEAAKRDAGRMDLEDVLLMTVGLLVEHPEVAAKVRAQYRQLVVDEFQDVSPVQSRLLEVWLGGRREICAVGDPAQTIFSFAGADPQILASFPARFPGATTLRLTRNYRSTPQIVGVAHQILRAVTPSAVPSQAHNPDGPEVRVGAYPDEVAEAEAVAARIAEGLAQGARASDFAVLVRINALTEAFEEAFSARGIPYAVRGGTRFFDRGEIREAVVRLRAEIRQRPDAEVGEVVSAALAAMGWTVTSPTTRGQARDRWESLESWRVLCASMTGTPADVVAELERRALEHHDPATAGVTLTTMHAAKGLEWPVVFVAGLSDGNVPISYAQDLTEIAEEGRLLYVAVTRARQELHLSWALARQPGGRGNRPPSRFLPKAAVAEVHEAASPQRARKRLVTCRSCGAALRTGAEKKLGRCAACPATYDEELFALLKQWRKERAEADKVPAYVVFTDATLTLIAEQPPASAKELLAISGVGTSKLEKYGNAVLEVIGSRSGHKPEMS